MAPTTSSMGAGCHPACGDWSTGRAAQTVTSSLTEPVSMIWDQRYEKSPLRTTRQRRPVANWRATASMAYVPPPGMTATEWAR
jgi:hypothetical protein